MTRLPQGEARLEPAGAGQSLRRQLSPPGSLPRPFRGGCSRCQRRPRRSTRSWQGHLVQHLALEARVPRIVWGLPANLGDPAPGMHIARWRRRWVPCRLNPHRIAAGSVLLPFTGQDTPWIYVGDGSTF